MSQIHSAIVVHPLVTGTVTRGRISLYQVSKIFSTPVFVDGRHFFVNFWITFSANVCTDYPSSSMINITVFSRSDLLWRNSLTRVQHDDE